MDKNVNPPPLDNKAPFRRKGDLGIPFLIGLFALSIVLGVVVFRNYTHSEMEVTHALADMQMQAPKLSIEQCAQKNMEWYLSCHAMQQICDDTVSRMIKVCLVNGEKMDQCTVYGDDVFGYNFGAQQCAPYLKNRNQKKACADTWQAIADFCKVKSKKSRP